MKTNKLLWAIMILIGTARTSFLDAQEVGIGTTAPVIRLDIQAPASYTNDMLRVQKGTGTYLMVTNGGNVGIGTATPQRPLHIVGSRTTNMVTIENQNATGWSSIDFYDYTDTIRMSLGVAGTGGTGYVKDAYVHAHWGADLWLVSTAGDVTISTGGPLTAPSLVVKHSGKVGIGTGAPAEKLHVLGAIVIGNGGYSGVSDWSATPVPTGGAGTIIFSGGHFYGWTGSVWRQLDN